MAEVFQWAFEKTVFILGEILKACMHLTKRFLFCCVCVKDTHLPEEQNNEQQQEKSTNRALYDNRYRIKHFQEDKSYLKQNQGQIITYWSPVICFSSAFNWESYLVWASIQTLNSMLDAPLIYLCRYFVMQYERVFCFVLFYGFYYSKTSQGN